jgi:isoleucyl-tRNA synthetase
LEQHSQSYRKIRNTFRFLLGNLNDEINFETKVDVESLEEIEKYILHRVATLDLSFKNLNNNYDFHKIYVDILNFCTIDLSALYFDIRKDSLYCEDPQSIKRIGCIKILSVVLEFLLKWLSPILVFTCEEIYQIVKKEELKESIFLHSFKQFPEEWIDLEVEKKWDFLKKLRSEVNNSIELKRNEKIIGSSLEANVHISLDNKYLPNLEKIDLAELLICSSSTLNDKSLTFDSFEKEPKTIEGLKVVVTKSEGIKCSHCWKILPSKCERNHCGIA